MEKCVSCQFYDRRNATHNDGKGTLWGQCRRTAPMLHPLNAKSYMVEGVWPHVRDDDWCGEWRGGVRRSEQQPRVDLMASNLQSVGATRISGIGAASAAAPAAASVGSAMTRVGGD